MRHLVAVAREEADATAVDVRERADAVPLQLPRPAVTCRWARAERRVHRPQAFGCELALGILGRIHAVDHPVLAARVEQHVAAARTFAVEGHLHLLRLELVGLVRAGVPHVIEPAPYCPLGISPAKVRYSSGWSSVWTARWFFRGSAGMPFGTAHDASTPSRSRRRSQCRRGPGAPGRRTGPLRPRALGSASRIAQARLRRWRFGGEPSRFRSRPGSARTGDEPAVGCADAE